jgi:predicted  nucleic acid-binding Zn-ribbon protein
MKSVRICIGCGKIFTSRRINHVNCTTKCKSDRHNYENKDKVAEQRNILKDKKKQDEVLGKIYHSTDEFVFFDEQYLEHLGIYLANAEKQIVDSNNSILRIEFTNYALKRTSYTNNFKLIKL